MTKIQIIARLWSAIYDLIFLAEGTANKSLEQIKEELKEAEKACEKYSEVMPDNL